MRVRLTIPTKWVLLEFDEAKKWVETTLNFDQDKYVSLFETTIRVLGGLLSAFHLTGDRVFLQKAEDIGGRLTGAFDSQSAIPYSDVNMKTRLPTLNFTIFNLRKGKAPSWGSDSSLSEVTSIQLEFRDLARSVNNETYEVLISISIVFLFRRLRFGYLSMSIRLVVMLMKDCAICFCLLMMEDLDVNPMLTFTNIVFSWHYYNSWGSFRFLL